MPLLYHWSGAPCRLAMHTRVCCPTATRSVSETSCNSLEGRQAGTLWAISWAEAATPAEACLAFLWRRRTRPGCSRCVTSRSIASCTLATSSPGSFSVLVTHIRRWPGSLAPSTGSRKLFVPPPGDTRRSVSAENLRPCEIVRLDAAGGKQPTLPRKPRRGGSTPQLLAERGQLNRLSHGV